MTGITSLDPEVASAEKAIDKMPPDKAVSFLLAKGVNPRLAGLVMKNRMLKQAAQSQAQAPQKTVAQEIDEHVNSIAAQHGAGISGLPLSGDLFQGGAGVAPAAPAAPAHFDGGGPVTDYMPQLMHGMYQKAAYQPGQGYQKPHYLMSEEEIASAAQQQAAAPRQGMAGGGPVGMPQQPPDPMAMYAAQQQAAAAERAKEQALMASIYSSEADRNTTGSGMAGGGIVAFAAGDRVLNPDLFGVQDEYAEYQRTHPMQRAPQLSTPSATDVLGTMGSAVGQGIHQGVRAIDRDIASPAMSAPPQTGIAPQGFPSPSAAAAPPTPEQTAEMVAASRMAAAPKGLQQQAPGPGGPAPDGAAPGGPAPAPVSTSASASVRGRAGGMSEGDAIKMAQDQVAKSEDLTKTWEGRTKSFQEHFAEMQELGDREGLGAAAKAHLEDLEGRKAQITEMAREGKWSAVMQAGFAMAEAATNNPHGGFLGALAVGGTKGGQMFTQALKEKREATSQLQDQQYAVMQAQENLKLHYSDKALDAHEKELGHLENAESKVMAANDRLVATVAGRELGILNARAMIASRVHYPNVQQSQWEAYRAAKTREEQQAVLHQIGDFNSAGTAATAAGIRADQAKESALTRLHGTQAYSSALEQAYRQPPYGASPGSDEYNKYLARRKSALDKIAAMERIAGAEGGGPPTPGNSPYSPELMEALFKYPHR